MASESLRTSSPSGKNGGGGGRNEDVQIATLNVKLIDAIERQAALEDALAVSRQRHQAATRRIDELEGTQRVFEEKLENGQLIERADVQLENETLIKRFMDESRQRVAAENDKRSIEQELELLTAQLFDEANKMVATARMDRELAERRADQVRARLVDTETLLGSHQEQLAELKSVMQQMSLELGQRQREPMGDTADLSHQLATKRSRETLGKMIDWSAVTAHSGDGEISVVAASPGLEHRPHPIYRLDTPVYSDFLSFIRTARANIPASPMLPELRSSSASSSPQIPTSAFANPTSPPSHSNSIFSSPNLPSGSTLTSTFASTSSAQMNIPSSLRDWRFVKRTIQEDIDKVQKLKILE